MTVVEAMERALEVLKATAYEKGYIRTCDDLAAAIALTRKHYPRTLGGDIPERNED